MKLEKDIAVLVTAVMAEAGISEYRVEMGGKHPRVLFCRDGAERHVVMPGTPSDQRGLKNLARDLRHAVGLVRPEVAPPEELPSPVLVAAQRARLAAHPVSAPTRKDEQALGMLDRFWTSAVEIGRRQGAADPAQWGVERLERLVALGLAEGDGGGRYRRR